MMCWFWDLNWIKYFTRIGVTTYILCMSFFAFPQSSAHSFPKIPTVGLSIANMPPLPDTIDFNDDESGAYQFAYPFQVSIGMDDISVREDDDTAFYAVDIVSRGAYSLNVIFENVRLSPHSYLCVFGKDSSDFQKYTEHETNFSEFLPTALVRGDTLSVRFVQPKSELKSSWTIRQVAHDYRNEYQKDVELKSSKSSSCNVDINCTEGQEWQTEKRAVCKLVIQGITACTGTLMNNTSKDYTPYVLTANHCISNENKALKTVFYFDYENVSCGYDYEKTPKTISGSTLVATSPDGKLDFSLVKLPQSPPKSYNPYYAGWNISDEVEKGTVCIHHPKGDVKKISVDNAKPTSVTFKTKTMTYATDAHWKVASWEVGTTEAGSSGSALFDADHLVIGSLSGGEATCETPVNDFFSKLSKAWDYYDVSTAQLKPWLDPLNLGVSRCSGFDPYQIAENVYTNVQTIDTLCRYNFCDRVQGEWTSANEMGWDAFAERCAVRKSIYDITFSGKIDTTEHLSDVSFCVWQGTQSPETLLFSVEMDKSMIQDSANVYVKLPHPISVQGLCWIGYKVQHNSCAFVGYIAKAALNGDLYVKHPASWVSTDRLGFPAQLAVLAHVTENPDTLQDFSYEKPFYANAIVDSLGMRCTDELFGIDSIGGIRTNTQFMQVSNSFLSNWSGPNEAGMTCFANKMTLLEPIILRDIKLAVAEVPNKLCHTELCVWNADFSKKIYHTQISNAELLPNHFNRVYLDTLLYIDSSFAYGVCFDSADYQSNISLLQYYDSEPAVDGYFCVNGTWQSYQDVGIPYNIGIQPIVAKSQYHFPLNVAEVFRYPIRWTSQQELHDKASIVVYPSICTTHISIHLQQTVCATIVVHIYNVRGEEESRGVYAMQDGKFTIPMSGLSAGVYAIQTFVGDQMFWNKVIHLKE